MPVIPEKIYRLVEDKLRNRNYLVSREKAALQRVTAEAIAPPGQAADGVRVKKSSPGKRTERAALKILDAEEKLRKAEQWADAFRLLDSVFPLSTPEGRAAAYVYDQGRTQAETCHILRCDRQTVRRRLDNYVAHAALIAASRGLIDIDQK